jgi:beta-glucosidase
MAPDLCEKTARAAAGEAAEDGVAITFAPMLDVARDPRWGRIVESPGENSIGPPTFAQHFMGAPDLHGRQAARRN